MKCKCRKILIISMFLLIPVVLTPGSWSPIGLEGKNVISIAVHPVNPDIILAADHDSLYRTTTGGTFWQIVGILPAREILFHPLYPDTVFAVWGNGSYSDGIYRSINAGETFDVLNYFYMATSISIPSWPTSGHMLAGLDSSGGVYRSTDYGGTWFPYSDSLTDRNVLSLFCIEPFDSTYIPLAGVSTGIYYWDLQGFWSKSNSENLPCVSISTGYPIWSHTYAALCNGSWSDGVYKSTDLGKNWTISWAWIDITSVLVKPYINQVIFAADLGYGVIMSTNGGGDWVEINENLGDLRVNDLAMSKSDTMHLYAATCSGIYKYAIDEGIIEVAEENNNGFVIKLPSLATCGSQIRVTCYLPVSMNNKRTILSLWDITGRKFTSKKVRATFPKTEFSIELPLSSGIYFLTIETTGTTLKRKITVLKK